MRKVKERSFVFAQALEPHLLRLTADKHHCASPICMHEVIYNPAPKVTLSLTVSG